MGTIQGRSVVAALVLGLFAGAGSERPAQRAPERAALKLVINTAARELYVYEDGERTATYPVAVGQPGHRTPHGSYSISKVVWNPWWRPPAREWASGESDTPPGPNNPMGRVKMYFRNLYYIHGTPYTSSLGRAASHGCVRMSNGDAIELARLVHEYGGGASSATIDRLVANSSNTRTIALDDPIPLEITSRSAAVENGRLELFASSGAFTAEQVRRDAITALHEAGFDLAKLDRERLRDLVAIGMRAPVSASVDELRAPAPGRGLVRVNGS